MRRCDLTDNILARFLSEVEGLVQRQVHNEDGPGAPAVLSVPHPFDRIYWIYILAMIDFTEGNKERYQMSDALFKQALREYASYYLKKREAE